MGLGHASESKHIPGSDVVHPGRWKLEEPHPVPIGRVPGKEERDWQDGMGNTAFKLQHGVPPSPDSSRGAPPTPVPTHSTTLGFTGNRERWGALSGEGPAPVDPHFCSLTPCARTGCPGSRQLLQPKDFGILINSCVYSAERSSWEREGGLGLISRSR